MVNISNGFAASVEGPAVHDIQMNAIYTVDSSIIVSDIKVCWCYLSLEFADWFGVVFILCMSSYTVRIG